MYDRSNILGFILPIRSFFARYVVYSLFTGNRSFSFKNNLITCGVLGFANGWTVVLKTQEGISLGDGRYAFRILWSFIGYGLRCQKVYSFFRFWNGWTRHEWFFLMWFHFRTSILYFQRPECNNRRRYFLASLPSTIIAAMDNNESVIWSQDIFL